MRDRDCETCVYARTPDNPYDNGCTAWECEYINRQEAIKAYKGIRNTIILRLNYFMKKDEFDKVKKEWEAENPDTILIPLTMSVENPRNCRGLWVLGENDSKHYRCSVCGYGIKRGFDVRRIHYCPDCGAKMEGIR